MSDLLLQSSWSSDRLGPWSSPNEHILACSLEDYVVTDEQTPYRKDAVAIADLLSSSESQTGMDLVVVAPNSSVLVTDGQQDVDPPGLGVEPNLEAETSLDSRSLPIDDSFIAPLDSPDGALDLALDSDQEEALTKRSPPGFSAEDEFTEIDVEVTPVDPVPEQEWPSIDSPIPGSDVASLPATEWPSLLLYSKLMRSLNKLWMLNTILLNGLRLLVMMRWTWENLLTSLRLQLILIV